MFHDSFNFEARKNVQKIIQIRRLYIIFNSLYAKVNFNKNLLHYADLYLEKSTYIQCCIQLLENLTFSQDTRWNCHMSSSDLCNIIFSCSEW